MTKPPSVPFTWNRGTRRRGGHPGRQGGPHPAGVGQVQLDLVLGSGARADRPQFGVHRTDRPEQVQGLVDQMRPEVEQRAAALGRRSRRASCPSPAGTDRSAR